MVSGMGGKRADKHAERREPAAHERYEQHQRRTDGVHVGGYPIGRLPAADGDSARPCADHGLALRVHKVGQHVPQPVVQVDMIVVDRDDHAVFLLLVVQQRQYLAMRTDVLREDKFYIVKIIEQLHKFHVLSHKIILADSCVYKMRVCRYEYIYHGWYHRSRDNAL